MWNSILGIDRGGTVLFKAKNELENKAQSLPGSPPSKMGANALLEWHLCVLGYLCDFQNLEVGTGRTGHIARKCYTQDQGIKILLPTLFSVQERWGGDSLENLL